MLFSPLPTQQPIQTSPTLSTIIYSYVQSPKLWIISMKKVISIRPWGTCWRGTSSHCHPPLTVLWWILMTTTHKAFRIFYTSHACTILMTARWKERKVTLSCREHSAIIYFHNLKNHHISHLENSDSVANNTVFEKCKVTIQILNRKRIN